MYISLAKILKQWTALRSIVTISMDWTLDNANQLPESFQIVQDQEKSRYIALHHMGSRIVGIVFVGASLEQCLEETIKLVH